MIFYKTIWDWGAKFLSVRSLLHSSVLLERPLCFQSFSCLVVLTCPVSPLSQAESHNLLKMNLRRSTTLIATWSPPEGHIEMRLNAKIDPDKRENGHWGTHYVFCKQGRMSIMVGFRVVWKASWIFNFWPKVVWDTIWKDDTNSWAVCFCRGWTKIIYDE